METVNSVKICRVEGNRQESYALVLTKGDKHMQVNFTPHDFAALITGRIILTHNLKWE